MSNQDAVQRWYPLVREIHESDLPVAVIARRHGVNAKTLGWWKLRFERGEVACPRAFVEVHLPQDGPVARTMTLRFEQRDLTLEVASDVEPEHFRRLVDSLC